MSAASYSGPPGGIEQELWAAGVRVRSKADSRLMRLIGWVLRLIGNKSFVSGFWTTMSARTIWAPTSVDLSRLDRYATVIRHELVHCGQSRRWPVLWQLGYLFVFFPAGISWVRWVSERNAYMVNIREGGRYEDEIERIVQTLWSNYGWCWPRKWMRRWFLAQLRKEGLRW